MLVKIISSGQNRIERIALDCADAAGIEWGGWTTQHLLEQSGHIPKKYLRSDNNNGLLETDSTRPMRAVYKNIEDAHCTLIVYHSAILPPRVKSVITQSRMLGKPYYISSPTQTYHVQQVVKLVIESGYEILNIVSDDPDGRKVFIEHPETLFSGIISGCQQYELFQIKIWNSRSSSKGK